MPEMTEIFRFNAGDAVPDWILKVTPMNDQAVRGRYTFERNTAVIKVDDVFWLLCLDSPHMQAVIRVDDSTNMAIEAATADVALASAPLVLAFKYRDPAPGQVVHHYATLEDMLKGVEIADTSGRLETQKGPPA